ncbi:hypothetical protein [Tenacibaculum finnmarkense]|uniref:hypothetical protein n=1 Tax=Tenacibaculum finnmarkense TaxID=2781243 RepID=UPI001EFA33C0|nr:hypothetical protein [Tenacibaculum finnmarkense]MCG8208207.1 hypothetical protein [Tenacibaculum finnmarkense genomovar finnmarkense]MCM8907328.1 hypothetical protein [Tenacibaculum finnmarkense genomovar finnmarkense]
MKLKGILDRNKELFSGKVITQEEKLLLKEKFKTIFFIDNFIDLLLSYPLSESCFSINEEEDLSELGVELQWFSPSEMIEEAYDSYPGICAIKEGYLPLGKCMEGSGDPYFIKNVKEDYNIYRVPHDAIINEVLKIDEIELVCALSVLLQKIDI